MRQRVACLTRTVEMQDATGTSRATYRDACECWRERWNEAAGRWEAVNWAVRGFGPSLETALADLMRAEHDHMMKEA